MGNSVSARRLGKEGLILQHAGTVDIFRCTSCLVILDGNQDQQQRQRALGQQLEKSRDEDLRQQARVVSGRKNERRDMQALGRIWCRAEGFRGNRI